MFSINFVGQAAFVQWINKKAAKAKERKDINQKATIIVDRWIQKNFDDQGKIFGGWHPLSPVTIALRKRNKTGNVRILEDTGQLKTRWKHLYDDHMAAVQSGVPYAKYHNEGGWHPIFGRGLVHTPKRQILPEREHIWDKLYRLFSADLRKRLNLKAY